jgi:DNA-directed RNA polymerase specialized sigma24 family protein
VHEALDEIAAFDARLAKVVELRCFGGLTEPEIAQALGVTDRTRMARLAKGKAAPAPGIAMRTSVKMSSHASLS